jgi:transposase InsO family protein
MRYDFVESHRGRWPVRLMCRVLAVSPGGYYDWRGRPQSDRTRRREALAVAIKAVHREVKARYGSPRVHAELVARGEACCVNTVARLMREHGVAAKTKRKFRCTTDSNHDRPVAENVVNRRFVPAAADEVWTADITYIPTREGWPYLAAVEDLHSRRIVGWSMSGGSTAGWWSTPWRWPSPDDCRMPAWWRTRTGAASTPASTTSGCLAGHGITCSMSRRANCWDNAPMESFFASLKKERTTTTYRQRRCRRGYNRGSRVSVGLARPGPLLSGASRLRRRSYTMPDRPILIPPRA